MKTFAPINIVIHHPKTEKGWRELKRRMATVHADAILNSISRLDCPASQKERLVQAIIDDAKAQIKAEKAQKSN